MGADFLKNKSHVEHMLDNDFGEKIRENFALECADSISEQDFRSKYLDKSKPLLLRGLTTDWPAIGKWDFDYFANQYGDIESYTDLYDASAVQKENIRSFVQRLKDVDASDRPIYLQEWAFQADSPELMQDYSLPAHFKHDWFEKLFGYQYSTLWMGSQGSSTFLHRDTLHVNVCVVQIYGEKEWFLFDKEVEIPTSDDGGQDDTGFLSALDGRGYHVVMQPGDILFVPYKWWHRTKAKTNSISLNTFFITENIVSNFVKEFCAAPLALVLNGELLKEKDPTRYNICNMRAYTQAKLMGFNTDNILGV